MSVASILHGLQAIANLPKGTMRSRVSSLASRIDEQHHTYEKIRKSKSKAEALCSKERCLNEIAKAEVEALITVNEDTIALQRTINENNSKLKKVKKSEEKVKCAELRWWAREGHYNRVKILVESEININDPDEDGNTSLHFACKNGHEEVMNELISNGSNVEAVNKDGETSFLIAAKYGHLNLISTLNARGCNIRAKSKNGQGALHLASTKGHLSLVKKLLELELDLHQTDEVLLVIKLSVQHFFRSCSRTVLHHCLFLAAKVTLM
eukprot:m.183311 g.183311  ORF g.183311 m.183311 type:complete len:267 (+) comp39304_c0_seq71:811-1611(+)